MALFNLSHYYSSMEEDSKAENVGADAGMWCWECVGVIFLIVSVFSVQFSSVAHSCLTLCDPWTAAHQASLPITNSRSLLKLMSIESVMPSNCFILCQTLLFPPSIFPSIRVFSNESALPIR